MLQQHWLSNEQAWLRFQQVGPKSKHGGLSPPGPPLTLTTASAGYPLSPAVERYLIIGPVTCPSHVSLLLSVTLYTDRTVGYSTVLCRVLETWSGSPQLTAVVGEKRAYFMLEWNKMKLNRWPKNLSSDKCTRYERYSKPIIFFGKWKNQNSVSIGFMPWQIHFFVPSLVKDK